MKNLYCAFLVVILFYSCSDQKKSNILLDSRYTFSFDTLMVDPGEDLIFMGVGFMGATFDNDKNYFFKLGGNTPRIEKINTNTFKLEEVIEFDQEGPNGIGSYIIDIKSKSNEDLVLLSYQQLGVFNKNGDRDFNIRPLLLEFENLDKREQIDPLAIISDKNNTLYLQINSNASGDTFLGKVDLENDTLEKLLIPGFDYNKNFRISFIVDRSGAIHDTRSKMQLIDDDVYLTSRYMNSIAKYDTKADTLIMYTYDPILTADRKTAKYKTEQGSFQGYQDEVMKLEKEITFGQLYWDDQRKNFYRFSQIGKSSFDELGKEKVDSYQVYFTILSENFQVLDVQEIENLKKMPEFALVKDSKIWMDINVEDEFGIVQMSINQKN
ncbi:protein of unknown function [Belliella buryatensis]|uniref:DUF4221 domain-containing protein n=1 Tax=Belliella buryatensis TaxID=1500549 RepID=A0A239FR63_9BACT|nr:DUF4221 family protein [Belliella buryatensis]SNS59427.1 protein of unknown function [Belliella buryatensis]